MKTLSQKLQKISWIWLILAVFFSKELLWSYLTPPWQAPDEPAHFGYVETLFYEHSFPVFGQTLLSERAQAIGPVDPLKEIDYYKGSPALNWIAQHPPLYYLALQPLYALLPHDDPFTCIFFLRIISILLGCVTLWYAHKTLKIFAPGKELLQKAVIVGMAFLPMFSAISASMNNDNLVFMLASILTYLSVKNFDEHDTRGSLLIGITLGLLALTKATSLPLFLSIFLIEIVKHWRLRAGPTLSVMARRLSSGKKNYPGCFIKHQTVIFGSALVIAGWWYARNMALYQMFLPSIASLAVREPGILKLHPSLSKIFPEITGIPALPNATLWDFFVKEGFLWEYYKNVWGAFGRFFFRLFSWQYAVIGGLTLASLCGYIKLAVSEFPKKFSKETFKKILASKAWTMILPFLAVSAGIIYELFKVYRERGFLGAMHGRYFFSALIAFMYLFIRGIEHLSGKKNLGTILMLVMVFFVANDVITLIYRIIPEYF